MPETIVCNGTMVDLLKLFVEKYQLNYSYHDADKESLNIAGGADLVINPHSYKIDRFLNFSYGFPFMTTPEYIFTKKPDVEVDSLGIATVFDSWSYIFILTSILVISLVFIVIIVLRKIRYPLRYNQTILYVVAAFFQETFPKSKLPKEGFKVKNKYDGQI